MSFCYIFKHDFEASVTVLCAFANVVRTKIAPTLPLNESAGWKGWGSCRGWGVNDQAACTVLFRPSWTALASDLTMRSPCFSRDPQSGRLRPIVPASIYLIRHLPYFSRRPSLPAWCRSLMVHGQFAFAKACSQHSNQARPQDFG